MSIITGLFGGTENAIWTGLLALGVVLVLIIFAVWALKMLFAATSSVGRGRNRRLAIVDQIAVDQKRQLILVRRDNVEHLVMVGSSHDLVVETGIEPPVQAASAGTRPTRRLPESAEAKSAAPVAFGTDAVEPTAMSTVSITPSVEGERPGANQNPLERLRELGRPVNERNSTSLRHTGLLKPGGRLEPVVSSVGPQESTQLYASDDADSVKKAAERAELAIAAASAGGTAVAADDGTKSESKSDGKAEKLAQSGKSG